MKAIHKQWWHCSLVFAILPALAAFSLPAQAQTLTVLYSFTGGADGIGQSSVILDAAGNFYGTMVVGGSSVCNYGCGTLFKVDSTGTFTILYSFTGKAGAYPVANLIRDAAGNLYGTAFEGGTFGIHDCPKGCGTVFRLDTADNITVLHSFINTDGSLPESNLIRDSAGNVYGTTEYGGTAFSGTVFKIDPTGRETVLYSFPTRGPLGVEPAVGVIRDAAGNLYGTTQRGGNITCGCGAILKLDANGNASALHTFAGTPDGTFGSALVMDSEGNLYGTAIEGGAFDEGTLFKLDKTSGFTVLHNFGSTSGDGVYPTQAGLTRDGAGNLYGVTHDGGEFSLGTVFEYDATGTMTTLYSFTTADGGYPNGGVTLDAAGNLYGTTSSYGALGYGSLYEITH